MSSKVLIAGAMALTLAIGTPVMAQVADSAASQAQIDDLKIQLRLLENQVDTLKANDQQVTHAIGALQANVKSHQTKLVQANQRSAAAEQELADALTAADANAAHLAHTQAATHAFAPHVYA